MDETTRRRVTERGHELLSYATHFAPRDWNWTRDHRIKRYYTETLVDRLKNTVKAGWRLRGRKTRTTLWDELPLWQIVRAHWNYYNRLPDGALDGGNVVAHWEETGEYLQMVQPSVGELVARFLIEDPENEWAVRIADELDRISKRYSERLKKGNVE